MPHHGDADGETGEEHGAARSVDGPDGGLLQPGPGPNRAAVPGHDEQGVVHPYPEPDEHPEHRGEGGDGRHVAEQTGQDEPDGDGEEGGDDGQGRGRQGAEGEEQHDERQEDSDGRAGARLRLL